MLTIDGEIVDSKSGDFGNDKSVREKKQNHKTQPQTLSSFSWVFMKKCQSQQYHQPDSRAKKIGYYF